MTANPHVNENNVSIKIAQLEILVQIILGSIRD